MPNRLGTVYLVGAGPGDPDLRTLKGKNCLEQAEVILYDRLVGAEMLEHAAQDAELIYVGKQAGRHCANQREIEQLLVRKAREGVRERLVRFYRETGHPERLRQVLQPAT